MKIPYCINEYLGSGNQIRIVLLRPEILSLILVKSDPSEIFTCSIQVKLHARNTAYTADRHPNSTKQRHKKQHIKTLKTHGNKKQTIIRENIGDCL